MTTGARWPGWLMPAILAGGVAAMTALARMETRMRLVRYPASEIAAVKNIHDYRGRPLCQACHVRLDMSLLAAPVALCQKCHRHGHRNHPVEVAMKGDASRVTMPLGPGRTVVCHTCHDPHDVTSPGYGMRMDLTAMCLQCHPGH